MNLKVLIVIGVIVVLFGMLVLSNQVPINNKGEEYILDPDSGNEFDPEDFTDPNSLGGAGFAVEPAGFEKATSSADCESKTDPFFHDDCYSNLALLKNDFSYCNSISQQNIELVDLCFYDLALKEKSSGLCMKMNFGITDCLTEVALLTGNPKFCEEAGFEKNNCFEAVRKNDFDLCKKLGENRRLCNDAVSEKNTVYCNEIIDASNYCFEQLGLKTSNPEYCSKMNSNPDDCYYEIAVATNNPNICGLLTEGKDLCVALIAFNTGNPVLCGQAGSERQSCLADLGQ